MYKLIFLCFISLMFFGCNPKVVNEQPLGYSFMPKYLELDSILPDLPKLPDSLAAKTALDYKPKPIFGGKYIDGKDTVQIPPGILTSEKSYVGYIFYEAAHKRMLVELEYTKYLTKEYYDKSLSAEKLYQDEIKRLTKKAQRSWLELNLPYFSFFGGILTAVLTEWAILRVSR